MCSFAFAPLLALAVPAAANDSGSPAADPTATTVAAPGTDPTTYVAQDTTPSSDPHATDPSTTVDTTPATDPPTSVDTTPSTDPPTSVDTTPPTQPPTTAPPVTSSPTTVGTTPVTTAPGTTPTTAPQALVPPAGSSDSGGGSSSSASGTSASGTGQTAAAGVAVAPDPATTSNAKSSGGVIPAVSSALASLPQAILITNPSNNDPFTATIAVPIRAQQAIGPVSSAVESLSAELQQALNPHTDSAWGLGSSAPRLLPWVVLLAVAWLIRLVAAAVLADRTAGPRRRRWTHL